MLSGVELLVNSGDIQSNPQIIGKAQTSCMIIDLNGHNTKPNRFGRDAFLACINTEKGFTMHYSDDGERGAVQRTREQLKMVRQERVINVVNKDEECGVVHLFSVMDGQLVKIILGKFN